MVQFFDFGTEQAHGVARIGPIVHGPGGLAASPDGKTVLFVQEAAANRDIMLVEDID